VWAFISTFYKLSIKKQKSPKSRIIKVEQSNWHWVPFLVQYVCLPLWMEKSSLILKILRKNGFIKLWSFVCQYDRQWRLDDSSLLWAQIFNPRYLSQGSFFISVTIKTKYFQSKDGKKLVIFRNYLWNKIHQSLLLIEQR